MWLIVIAHIPWKVLCAQLSCRFYWYVWWFIISEINPFVVFSPRSRLLIQNLRLQSSLPSVSGDEIRVLFGCIHISFARIFDTPRYYSLVCEVTLYGPNDQDSNPRKIQNFCLTSKGSPSSYPVENVGWFLGVKWPEREADHPGNTEFAGDTFTQLCLHSFLVPQSSTLTESGTPQQTEWVIGLVDGSSILCKGEMVFVFTTSCSSARLASHLYNRNRGLPPPSWEMRP
jgi:hypothetical protein